jgi:hypothetical protein
MKIKIYKNLTEKSFRNNKGIILIVSDSYEVLILIKNANAFKFEEGIINDKYFLYMEADLEHIYEIYNDIRYSISDVVSKLREQQKEIEKNNSSLETKRYLIKKEEEFVI